MTLKKAYETAISMVTAAKVVLDLQSGTPHAETVNEMSYGEIHKKTKVA